MTDITFRGMTVYLGWGRTDALISFVWNEYSLLLGVGPSKWRWGHGKGYYDGPFHWRGMGPLFLFLARPEGDY